jgi:hypothetical protein
MLAIILTERGEFMIAARDGIRLSAYDAETVTGWTLKPEGMCRDEVCVPLAGDAVRDGTVDVAAFWRMLGQPVVSDEAGETWVLGTGADSRMAALAGLEAPDFSLPDLTGATRQLSELRGKKVFLTTWASW